MRKFLECCNLPTSLIDRLAPYTFDQAKQALLKSDFDLLTKILSSSPRFPQQQDSLLLVALSQGKQESVLFLLRQFKESCQFTRRNDKGDTPIMVAIFRKMHKAIRILIQKCDVNGCDFRRNTAFIAASANGDIQSLKMLQQSGKCNTLMKNYDGQTALHRACYFGQMAAVDWLLQNTDLRVRERDRKGNNCLHLACQGLNLTLTRYLMQKVKNSHILLEQNSQGMDPLQVLMKTIQVVAPQFKQTLDVQHLKLP